MRVSLDLSIVDRRCQETTGIQDNRTTREEMNTVPMSCKIRGRYLIEIDNDKFVMNEFIIYVYFWVW